MSALGLKTKKRHIRSPDGQAASMVQRDGFCNPRWELRCHYYCGAKAPDLAWGGGGGESEEGGSGLRAMLHHYTENRPSHQETTS